MRLRRRAAGTAIKATKDVRWGTHTNNKAAHVSCADEMRHALMNYSRKGRSHENSEDVRPLPSVNQSGVKVTLRVLAPDPRFFTNCASSGWPGLP